MSEFSTKQYGWKDLAISFGGKIIDGVTDVEYSRKQVNEYLRGRGSKPYEILEGNDEYEGTLELWQSVIEAMVADAPGKDICKLRFDIVVAYVPEDGGPIVIDVLKRGKITEYTKGMKQGDTHKLITCPIMFLDIEHQA